MNNTPREKLFGRHRPEIEAKRLANLKAVASGPRSPEKKAKLFGNHRPEIVAKRLAKLKEYYENLVVSPETRAKISASLKALWASGKRKPNPREAYEKAAITRRKTIASGNYKRRDPEEMRRTGKYAQSCADYNKVCLANRILAEKRRGKEMAKINRFGKPSRCCKSPNHWKAKWWSIERHDGIVLEGKNLNQLIRENSQYFHPDDVVWRGPKCRASKGIRQLYEGRVSNTRSWKGWGIRNILEAAA